MAASSSNRLDTLPPELRSIIYAHVFCTEMGGLISVRVEKNGDWADDSGVAPEGFLRQDPGYIAHRGKETTVDNWPNHVEDAFLQGCRKATKNSKFIQTVPARSEAPNEGSVPKDMIETVICEHTGERRSREQVACHLQRLKRISSQIPEVPGRLKRQVAQAIEKREYCGSIETTEHVQQLFRIGNAVSMLKLRLETRRHSASNGQRPAMAPEETFMPQPAGSLCSHLSRHTPRYDQALLIWPTSSCRKYFLALKSVNRRIRAETLRYLDAKMLLDFGSKIETLQTLCEVIPPGILSCIRSIKIRITEVLAYHAVPPDMSLGEILNDQLPNLQKMFIHLVPRDPTRIDYNTLDWGLQKPDFLLGLRDVDAEVILCMLWEQDCDIFERDYLGPSGWQCLESKRWSGLKEILSAHKKYPTMVAGTNPPSLPPSVEEAYRKKCIELRRRTLEVEESNDTYRVRKARLQRGIRKMRLERAYLLEILGKRMNKNSDSVDPYMGPHDEDSEGSSEAPPTPNEKPLRSKRSHRRPVSSPPPPPGHQQHRPLAPSQSHPTSAFEPPRDPFRESHYQHTPTTNGHAPIQYPVPLSSIPTHAISPDGQPLRQPPAPPPTAFQEFLHRHVLAQPDRFQYRDEEDAIRIAQEAWRKHDSESRLSRELYQDIYERNLGRYNHELHEYNLMNERLGLRYGPPGHGNQINIRGGGDNDDEMEVKSELPQPPPSREGGVGGFTSING